MQKKNMKSSIRNYSLCNMYLSSFILISLQSYILHIETDDLCCTHIFYDYYPAASVFAI